ASLARVEPATLHLAALRAHAEHRHGRSAGPQPDLVTGPELAHASSPPRPSGSLAVQPERARRVVLVAHLVHRLFLPGALVKAVRAVEHQARAAADVLVSVRHPR